MSSIEFVCMLLCCFAVIEFIGSLFKMYKGYIYHRIYIREKVRQDFGDLRTRFFHMAREGKISFESRSFHVFFCAFTGLIRRPDKFDDIASSLVKILAEKEKKGNSISEEIKAWPKENFELITRMVEIFEGMVIQFAPPAIRLVVWLLNKLPKFVLSSIGAAFSIFITRNTKKSAIDELKGVFQSVLPNELACTNGQIQDC